jgi:hypothetical protein
VLQAQDRASIAQAYETLGNTGGAREQWGISAQRAVDALALDETDQRAAEMVSTAYAALAALDEAANQSEDAAANYEQALAYATSDAMRGEYQARLALLYHEIGDDESARTAAAASLDLLAEGDSLRAEVEAMLAEIEGGS